MPAPAASLREQIISRIKVQSRLDIAEKRLPQDGRLQWAVHQRMVDMRVSSLPTLHGEKLVLRILDIQSQQLSFEHLGLPHKELDQLMQAIHRPNGMVLITGPTGSGKTVTLYTCLNHLNTSGVNIATVEDPSEIVLAGANQVNVNERIGLSFDVALRALLRQDPDIVMVGEIRDLATADIAIKASQTGHLVLSTCTNRVYALSTLTVHDKVMQGISLAQALRQLSSVADGYPAVFSKLYPSLLVQLIDIGEQSGTLSALLNKAADAQDEALAHQVQSMTQLIEPLLVVVLGGLVGGMVVALYLPVFQLGQIM
jgi:Tfp pilus assembly pilus retraction ATPase PilT